MSKHTYAEIAADWSLWNEYVNTAATMSREEFDSLSTEQKVALQVEAFGPEAASLTEAQTAELIDFANGAANHGDRDTVALVERALAGDKQAADQALALMAEDPQADFND